MQRPSSAIFALLLVSGCGHNDADPAPAPDTSDHGDWVPFYSRTSEGTQRQYFYDRSSVERTGNLVRARWKTLNTGAVPGTTLYGIEIQCREGTFTELGTVLIDSAGHRQDVPHTELWVHHPIGANTSTASFQHLFCR